MKKPYSGNKKPFITVLFRPEEKAKVIPVLEALQKKGTEIYGSDGIIRRYRALKAAAFVDFRETEGPEFKALTDEAERNKIPVIALRTAEAEADSGAEKTAERILEMPEIRSMQVTERQKRCIRIRIAVVTGLVLTALTAGVLAFGAEAFGWFRPDSRGLIIRSVTHGDLTLLEHLIH